MIIARDRSAGHRPVLASQSLAWRVALVVAGTVFLALASRIAIPLPFSPVPVTGQTFAVAMIGAALGARLGALTVAVYILEGAAGLPVFAGGTAGLARVVGPTGGYLIGFVAAAAIVGWLAERGWTRRVSTTAAALLLAQIAIYVLGLIWLSRFPLSVGVLEAGLLPFVAGDLYKIALAAVLLPPLTRASGRTARG